MNCLCCGKKLSLNESENGWHKACIKKFFGTTVMPEIEIDKKSLEQLAEDSVNKGYTVAGVQKKLSLHLHSDNNTPRLTLVNYPTGYILKPQTEQFTALPQAEQLVMTMADYVGISTVPHALINQNGNYAYITKRIDRVFEKDKVKMLAMEDFCQLDLRLTQDKYKGSYERCAKIIDSYSYHKSFDKTELFMRIIFSFITGNSDMHLKNLSLIETDEGSGKYILSPAYDLLPVKILLPEDREDFALSINKKKIDLKRKDFFVFAYRCGISQKPAEKMIAKLLSMIEQLISICENSLLPDDLKKQFIELINNRCKILST